MITIRSDINGFYGLNYLMDDNFSLEISSDNEISGEIIKGIISQVFSGNEIVYKAYGLPNSIDEIIEDFGGQNYVYHEGDRNKFYMKRYPEIIMQLKDIIAIDKLLSSWSCAIIEGRFFFIAKPSCGEQIKEYFQNNSYKERPNMNELWDFLLCIIENIPDHPNHDSYILTARKEFHEEINQLICKFL